MNWKSMLFLTIWMFTAGAGFAWQVDDDRGKPDKLIAFKTFDEGNPLNLHVFEPEGHSAEKNVPAIVFFFGGGWRGFNPTQFYRQSRYFASRGMVAMCAEYRTANSHKATPFECVADGKSAIRWVRAHAAELGVDPDKIIVGGGSSGGHVAACTGVIEGFEDENTGVSSKPVAMVLFNPATALDSERMAERLGGRQKEISPVNHVRKGLPPTIIFHGEDDTTVPFATAVRFTELMKQAGNSCELAAYPGKSHGFFNYGRDDNAPYKSTLRKADIFLTKLGYLSGKPTID